MTDQLDAQAERQLRGIGFWIGTIAVCAVVAVVLLVMGEPTADPSSGVRMPPAPAVAVIVALGVIAAILLVGRRGWVAVRSGGSSPLSPVGRAVLVLVALAVGVGGAFWYGLYPLDVVSGGVAAMSPADWAAAAVALLTFLAGLTPAWLLPRAGAARS